MQPFALVGLAGTRLTEVEAETLASSRVAGVLLFPRNVQDGDQLARLCLDVREAGHESLVIAADHEGGNVSVLANAIGRPPSALTLGIADDPDLTRRVHEVTARRARAVGIDLLLAPVADLYVPGNPVIATRAFGTDPHQVARHVSAAIAGLHDGGVAACVKHWPGHGRPRR